MIQQLLANPTLRWEHPCKDEDAEQERIAVYKESRRERYNAQHRVVLEQIEQQQLLRLIENGPPPKDTVDAGIRTMGRPAAPSSGLGAFSEVGQRLVLDHVGRRAVSAMEPSSPSLTLQLPLPLPPPPPSPHSPALAVLPPVSLRTTSANRPPLPWRAAHDIREGEDLPYSIVSPWPLRNEGACTGSLNMWKRTCWCPTIIFTSFIRTFAYCRISLMWFAHHVDKPKT